MYVRFIKIDGSHEDWGLESIPQRGDYVILEDGKYQVESVEYHLKTLSGTGDVDGQSTFTWKYKSYDENGNIMNRTEPRVQIRVVKTK